MTTGSHQSMHNGNYSAVEGTTDSSIQRCLLTQLWATYLD
jgi:hypothetical protein